MLVPYRGGQYVVEKAASRVHPLVGVADLLWRNRDRLSTGFRKLWSLLPGWSGSNSSKKSRKNGSQRMALMSSSRDFKNWVTGAPVTVGNITQNPVWMDIERVPTHAAGPGIRIVGRQLVCSLSTTNTTDGAFVAVTGGATISNVNSFRISPDVLNGRVALMSRNFARYLFRHVRVVHITRSATSTVGGFGLAIVADPQVTSFGIVSYPQIIQCNPSVAGPGWSCFAVEADNATDDLLWTELDSATDASGRQTVQYTVLGAFDTIATATAVFGEVFVEYVLDLYCPSIDYGFTLRVRLRSDEEVLFLEEQLEDYRRRRLPSSRPASLASWHDPSGELPTPTCVVSDGRLKPR